MAETSTSSSSTKCVGADSSGAKGTCARTGTILMRSLTIFFASRGSVNTQRRSSDNSQTRKYRRRKMPEGTHRYSARLTKIFDSLRRRTRFTRTELDALYKIYKKLTRSGQKSIGKSAMISGKSQRTQNVPGIDRGVFRDLLHNKLDILTEDCLVERMFCCWDRENECVIKLEPWILGLDVILRGNLREKIEFCFRVYDLNNDGYITKDEIFQLFKNSLLTQPGDEDPDESVRDLSELALKKLDADQDGKVSFQDYENVVQDEPLLLEALGQCLPTEANCRAFLESLQSK